MSKPAASSTSTASVADDELVVRRNHTATLKRTAVALAAASLVLFWVPALIVLIRREPGYFTAGILWTALVATALLLGLGLLAAWLWSRSGARRRPVLRADREGLRIPGGDGIGALDARWEQIALLRVVGQTDPELAVYLLDEKSEPPTESSTELDLSEPEFLRPLDFEADPPPPMRAPAREVFRQISPLEPTDDEPVAATPPKISRAESLHGTPYVVGIGGTVPSTKDVLITLRRLADGRVPLA